MLRTQRKSPGVGLSLFLILLVFASGHGFGAERKEELTFSPEAEKLFQKAIERYKQRHFRRARLDFQDILERMPKNQRSSVAKLMLAKTLYKLRVYDLAIATVAELRKEYPYSRYLAEGEFLVGDCYFRQKRYVEAAAQYRKVASSAPDIRLKAKAAERLGAMSGVKMLPDGEREKLRRALGARGAEEVLRYGEAQWYSRLGYFDLGMAKLRSFLRAFPEGQFASEARALLRKKMLESTGEAAYEEMASQDLLCIGVIAPLSGDEQEFGQDLRDGAILAYERYLSSLDEPIRMVVEDSESNLVGAVKATQRLILEKNALALVGPVTSTSTAGVAALANARGVPLLAPTASEDGIDSIGPFVFQLNATPGVQGTRIAEYAVQDLGLHSFAVIASLDSYGRNMSDRFAGTVSALGGEVLIQEWYFPGTKDFRKQFERIRETGLTWVSADSLLAGLQAVYAADSLAALQADSLAALQADSLAADSLAALQTDSLAVQTDSLGMSLPDSLRIVLGTPDADTLLNTAETEAETPSQEAEEDTTEVKPVTTIDGILIAASSYEDAVQIAPQLAFHRIKTQLLGGNTWSVRDVIRMGGTYVEDAVFVSEYFEDEGAPLTREFINRFRERYARHPSQVAALGYDAMSLVMREFQRQNRTRTSLRTALELTTGFQGVSGPISFAEDSRANRDMYFLKIKNGKIVKIEEGASLDSEERVGR